MDRRPIDRTPDLARREREQDRSVRIPAAPTRSSLVAVMLARLGALLVALAFLVSSGSLATAAPTVPVKGTQIVATDGTGSGHPAPVELLQATPSEPNRLTLPQPKGFADDDGGAFFDLIVANDLVFPRIVVSFADPAGCGARAGESPQQQRARAPPARA